MKDNAEGYYEEIFSPASLIHGELKVMEANKKGSCRSGSPSLPYSWGTESGGDE